MANERHKRLMQEALDESLSAESLQELYGELDREPENAGEFSRLKKVDRLLRTAPMERAPQSLALNIMARLAEGLQTHRLTRNSGLALALALGIVSALLLPALAALGWLILNALGSATALTQAISQLVGLLGMVMTALEGLVTGAQAVLAAYPEVPIVMLTLIPVGLFRLARFAWQNRQQQEEG
jgi:ferric-dicitrate binding protein FerR (iron transport regulator)